MENIKNIEEFEKYRQQIKEIFEEMVTDDFYYVWSDTFEIEDINEKRVVITYDGAHPIKEFKKQCKDILASCVFSLFGDGRKVKIIKKSSYKPSVPKAKKNVRAVNFFVLGMAFVCIATAIIIVLFNYIGNRNFKETFYNVSSLKVDSQIRVVQLSDMHGVSYGKSNQKLLERVKELEPDIIILTGDIVNSAKEDVDYAVNLGIRLLEIAPSYYIYGNHETETIYGFELSKDELDKKFGFSDKNRDETKLLELEDAFEQKLERVGMKVLKNEKDTIKIKNMTVDIYGVLTSNPSAFWHYTEKSFADYIYQNTDNIKITAIHEPFIFEEFQPEFWGDLMVAGHTHGGVMRVPVLGPLFTVEGGLFPERNAKFVYGRYDTAGKPLIVSGGLENSNVLRINNEPELVIIDINKF